MRLAAKIALVAIPWILLVVAAALWFGALNDVSLTHVLGPREVLSPNEVSQQSQETPAQGAESSRREGPLVWRVNCSDNQAGLDCRAVQTLFVKQTGQPFLSVVVHVPPDTKKPIMLIQAPLGTYLPAGVTLQFGQDAAKAVPFRNCNQSSCVAVYPVTEAEIGAMLNRANLAVSIQNRQRTPIKLTVQGADFPEAYAKMK
jgi:invasion protein IalB